jgi:hypothetical protein
MKAVNRLPLGDLPGSMREKAAELRDDFGAEGRARAVEWCADLVQEALDGHADEELTLAEATTESGYTRAHLLRLHRDEKMPMAANGTVLRRHIPRKPGHGVVANNVREVASSRSQLARAVAGGADA